MVFDFEETEARNDCAGEEQLQFFGPTNCPDVIGASQRGQEPWNSEVKGAMCVGSHYQTTGEDTAQ